ncbi:hypothetical protein QTN47_10530 [Danxiaibacter flavus]|uniref:GLPGLI family protein n=1 Tax=Danxiaibacter flavus TaxID=3049108 RepID=A0ABV3ZHG0_9BACT|nr:hypothetical protein QNM32_10535 [Chitinophagaceae bacterium DXS]
MKYIWILFFLFAGQLHAQKMVAECTIEYKVEVKNNNVVKGGTSSRFQYLKGKKVRIDIMTDAFTQKEIYDLNTGDAVVLKEVGANKYMSQLTRDKWMQQFEKFKGIKPTPAAETKTILGYECKKAFAKLDDDVKFTIYYTTAIVPSASENPYLAEAVPGFILQYEMANEKTKNNITYTATKISFSPVPSALFDIPTTGYRILK